MLNPSGCAKTIKVYACGVSPTGGLGGRYSAGEEGGKISVREEGDESEGERVMFVDSQ
jgi:hypothetical protein